jgi:tRNA dimethylallyltransferase
MILENCGEIGQKSSRRFALVSLCMAFLFPTATKSYFLTRSVARHSVTKLSTRLHMSSSQSSAMASEVSKMVVIIAGPTAAGKSNVAAVLCAKKKGIIVSADSVQAYRGVQIGANKPSLEERQETPHILVDVADHHDNYNAAKWKRDAVFTIQSLLSGKNEGDDEENEDTGVSSRRLQILDELGNARSTKGYGKDDPLLPVVCGGTMMYLQWLVHGQPDAMRPSEEAVEEATTIMSKYKSADDYQGAMDYVASLGKPFAERVPKLCIGDWYRLGRTLEVALTVKGQPNNEELIDALYTGERQGGLSSLGYDVRCFFLCPDDRMKHTGTIDERCEQMIMKGLLKETSDLSLSGCMPEMATRAIGYRQTLDYLHDESSVTSEAERFSQFLNDFTTATRRYAKQQMAWFRKDKEFIFVPVALEATKADRVESTTSSIQKYCEMSRQDYEKSLYGTDGESIRCKQANADQGKTMKFYQFKRHILKEGSKELESSLSEALECRRRIQAKRRRVDTEKDEGNGD